MQGDPGSTTSAAITHVMRLQKGRTPARSIRHLPINVDSAGPAGVTPRASAGVAAEESHAERATTTSNTSDAPPHSETSVDTSTAAHSTPLGLAAASIPGAFPGRRSSGTRAFAERRSSAAHRQYRKQLIMRTLRTKPVLGGDESDEDDGGEEMNMFSTRGSQDERSPEVAGTAIASVAAAVTGIIEEEEEDDEDDAEADVAPSDVIAGRDAPIAAGAEGGHGTNGVLAEDADAVDAGTVSTSGSTLKHRLHASQVELPSSIHARTRSEVMEMRTAQRRGPFAIALAVNVLNLGRIDTVAQTFEADFFMEARVQSVDTPAVSSGGSCDVGPLIGHSSKNSLLPKLLSIITGGEGPGAPNSPGHVPDTTNPMHTASPAVVVVDGSHGNPAAVQHTGKTLTPKSAAAASRIKAQIEATRLPEGWDLLDWIEFVNMTQVAKYKAWQTELADGRIAYRWRVQGVFATRFELRNFPWDRQELQIRISAARGVHMIRLVENTASPSVIQRNNFMLDNIWHLWSTVTIETGATPASASRSGMSRPLATVRLYIDRKSGYYLINIALPMALICAMSFSSFAIDPADLPSRLNVTLTLVLTAVAYKFVLAQSIPAVSYLTVLDKYILAQLIFLTAAVVENVISGSEAGQTPASGSEDITEGRVIQIVLALSWILFHVFFYVYFRYRIKRRPLSEDTAAPLASALPEHAKSV